MSEYRLSVLGAFQRTVPYKHNLHKYNELGEVFFHLLCHLTTWQQQLPVYVEVEIKVI